MRKASNTKSKQTPNSNSRRLTPKQMREFNAAQANPGKDGYPILSEKQARELKEAREAGRREEGEYPGLKEFFRKHGLM